MKVCPECKSDERYMLEPVNETLVLFTCLSCGEEIHFEVAA